MLGCKQKTLLGFLGKELDIDQYINLWSEWNQMFSLPVEYLAMLET